MLTRRLTATLLALSVLLGTVPGVRAAVTSDGQADSIGRTPPRLSYTNGDVSFWRPGAQDWAPAQVNTPLAPGDELYTAHEGNLELQVGGRAFVRAWGDTQLGLANHEPDFVQVKVTSGHVSLDLRTIESGRTVEVDTPHAAFTIERPGYYRVDVTQERTSFVTRRAGTAIMTPPGGQPVVTIAASEEVVLDGNATPPVQSYVAPDLDVWDRWNYARTDELIDAVSARYIPSGVYGVDDLDHNGNWRVVREYGAVWVPEAVPAGWAPYTIGKWIWDPFYEWTWVDVAPWGWAPYHYGRWVFVDGFWAWAPGPLIARPVYAPALVAFFGAPGVRVGVAVGAPFVSWVALGWGEPLVPWWGRPSFAGRAWWGGWGGPRVVNNVVVTRTTIVNVNNVTVYRNTSVQNAVVTVREEHFGRAAVHEARVRDVDVRQLQPMRGAPRVAPAPASFVGATGRAVRPPDTMVSRSVVATRPLSPRALTPRSAAVRDPRELGPRETREAPRGETREAAREEQTVKVSPPRIVPSPRPTPTGPAPTAAPPQPRPPFGASPVERPRTPAPPRFDASRPTTSPVVPREGRPESPARPEAPIRPEIPAQREVPPGDRTPALPHAAPAPSPAAPAPSPAAPAPPHAAPAPHPEQRVEPARPPAHTLPGEPANRLFPGRAQVAPPQVAPPRAEPARPEPVRPEPSRPESGRPGPRPGPGPQRGEGR